MTRQKLERVTCGRCGGTGRYAYCQTASGKYGPYTCFKCAGHGEVLTKRGAEANRALAEALKVPASTLRAGDRVHGPLGRGASVAVVELYQGSPERHSSAWIVDGEKVYGWHLECTSDDGWVYSWCLRTPTERVRKQWSPEEKQEKINLALEYQACLTKSGTIAKKHAQRAAEILATLSTETETCK